MERFLKIASQNDQINRSLQTTSHNVNLTIEYYENL